MSAGKWRSLNGALVRSSKRAPQPRAIGNHIAMLSSIFPIGHGRGQAVWARH